MSWFLERLRKYKDDRGMMAELRCALVETKRHRAWPVLSRLGIPIDDKVLPFVAGLYAMHPLEAMGGNFGATCRAIEAKRDQKAVDEKQTPTERRFQSLLAAERGEVQSRVYRLLQLAKSQDVPVNYEKLASDLKFWNDRTKTEWASAFWDRQPDNSQKEADQ